MAKQKSTTTESTQINQIVVNDAPEVQPSTEQRSDDNNTNTSNNSNKAVRIIQTRPSHYSLLMQDGTHKVVHKTLFDRSTMTILTDL